MILMTKYAGIEGTGIIIGDFERKCREVLSDDEIRQGRLLLDRVSVVEEGIIIGREGFCKMHDVTEGGVLGAVWETCSLIGLGCTVKEKSIPVLEITEKISRIFKIDCLRLISSGSMLVVAKREKADVIIEKLRARGILCTEIGSITEGTQGMKIERENGDLEKIEPPEKDEIYKVIHKEI